MNETYSSNNVTYVMYLKAGTHQADGRERRSG